MITLHPYQKDIATRGLAILQAHHIVYLALEVRTGKTLTALAIAWKYGAKSVLFLTRKKAIGSIDNDDEDAQGDYQKLNPPFKMETINYEQVHKLRAADYDLIICDEAHCMGAFAKPSSRTIFVKQIAVNKPIIFLSGTPSAESYCQLYHQFWVSSFSPFKRFTDFYAWATEYVQIQKTYYFNKEAKDYSNNPETTINRLIKQFEKKKHRTPADKDKLDYEIKEITEQTDAFNKKIQAACAHLFISFTQEQAGFIQPVKEEILQVEMAPGTYKMADYLRKHKVYVGRGGEEILADTANKLQNKFHQIFSGSVIDEQGRGIGFDLTKVKFIRDRFAGQKIGIFYKFKCERVMLISVFGSDRLTESPEEFAATDKNFISQILAGREGINLSCADCLVMLNIDFAAVSYWQVRARAQAKDKVKECKLYWIFARGGIEYKVYERVVNKKDYTLSYFKKDYSIQEEVA